jgi:aminobenzoyl-glutamate utilization protein B
MKHYDIADIKRGALAAADQNYEFIREIGSTVWGFAELARNEYRSARFLAGRLEQMGFSVRRGVAGFPTGFIGELDRGPGPIVGFLCEYDALPGLSSTDPGQPGHGCGHNLYAAAALGSALLLKTIMQRHDIPGRIRVYGTPSEESLGAKQYYMRQGLFDGVDVVFSTHQFQGCGVFYKMHNAIRAAAYCFHGRASHAGSMPELGRSALDALELMNVGLQFLREHITSDVRIHYAITDGGYPANVVPDYAAGEYVMRARHADTLLDIAHRVDLVARGAATMTETTVSTRFQYQYANTILNRALCKTAYENVLLAGPTAFDEQDQKTARSLGYAHGIENVITPLPDEPEPYGASTEEGDVSWVAPLVRICLNTAPVETPNHSASMTQQSNLPAAYKAVTQSTKAVVCTALDVLLDESRRSAIQEDHRRALEGKTYPSDGLVRPEPNSFPNAPGIGQIDGRTLSVNPDATILLEGLSDVSLSVYRDERLIGEARAANPQDDTPVVLSEPVTPGDWLRLFYRKSGDAQPTLLGYYQVL